jgi:predicted GNAT family acetyltransferase
VTAAAPTITISAAPAILSSGGTSTLTVTATNASAIRLYESTGFAVYGNLRRALKIGSLYHDKLHMALSL